MASENAVCDISFNEKLKVFSQEYLKCCTYIADFDVSQYVFTKKLYSKLISCSQLLEDFLDFHGAKNSTSWYFYRELSAAVRHLSLGGYAQKHISNRLIFYDLADVDSFRSKGYATLDFLTKSLINLAPVIIEEARRLDIPIPDERFDPAEFPGVSTSEILEYDIDDEDKDLQKKNVVKIASDFLRI